MIDPHEGPAGFVRPVAAVILTSIAASLPWFLTSALGVQIKEAFGITSSQLGLVAGLYLLVTAAMSLVTGPQVERFGWRCSIWAAGAISVVVLVGVGLAPSTLPILIVFMIVGGLGQSLTAPASALALVEAVPRHRQALVFGARQASIPAAAMIAGLALPAIAVSLGWRPAFVIMIMFPIAGVLLTGRPTGTTNRTPFRIEITRPHKALLYLVVAAGVGSAVFGSLGTFYVVSVVGAGISQSTAGLLFALGSLSVLVSRILVGWHVDRTGVSGILHMAVMLTIGAGGYFLFAFSSDSVAVLAVATVIIFAVGWGWTGLLQFAVASRNQDMPAAATGVGVVGMALGSSLGPIGFGAIIDSVSFQTGWLIVGAVSLFAALMLFALSRQEQRTAKP